MTDYPPSNQGVNTPPASDLSTEIAQRPCGSCGATPTYTIILHGRPVPACLRHLNHWRTPAPDYTCPTACVEQNHPGQEHDSWLTGHVPAPPQTISGSTGLVYCKACGFLLFSDRKGRTARADRPCVPVRVGLRTPPGLHKCEGCGLELDADDHSTRCDDCTPPASETTEEA